jgi:hypothetical protein
MAALWNSVSVLLKLNSHKQGYFLNLAFYKCENTFKIFVVINIPKNFAKSFWLVR